MYTCLLWEIQEMEPGINHLFLKSSFPKALIRMSSLDFLLCVIRWIAPSRWSYRRRMMGNPKVCYFSCIQSPYWTCEEHHTQENLDDDGKTWILLLLNVQYFSFATHFCYLRISFAQCRVHQSVLEKYYLTALFWFLRNILLILMLCFKTMSVLI